MKGNHNAKLCFFSYRAAGQSATFSRKSNQSGYTHVIAQEKQMHARAQHTHIHTPSLGNLQSHTARHRNRHGPWLPLLTPAIRHACIIIKDLLNQRYCRACTYAHIGLELMPSTAPAS
eukprot:571210-Pelagomonas_calceolata.AAC.4